MLYLTWKWLHFAGLISWMAGLLYLFRLFIYIRERGDQNPHTRELLVLMAHRLYRYITNPAMTAAFIAGLSMIYLNPALMQGTGWLHAKLTILLALSGWTGYGGRLLRRFKAGDPNMPSTRKLRVYNEVPTIMMLIIIALAVFRPF